MVNKNFSFTKNIIIIIIASLLALGAGGTAVVLGISNIPANRVSRYMGAAERYLSEMNYEQAVIEFQRVLEIESMNVDAYLGLADAYLAMGDTDKALECLNKGYEQTGDARIQAKIDELTKPVEPEIYAPETSEPEKPEICEPEVPETPAYGSMGSVTIAGTELDIATTSRLLIITKELYSNGNWHADWIDNPEEHFNGIVYITENISNNDLEKLQQLSNLHELEVDYADITDLSSISKLTNLMYLDLWDNQISDIRAVQAEIVVVKC